MPGWSTTREETPRRASHAGRPTRYFISLVESRPLTCTSKGARPLTPLCAHIQRREVLAFVGDLDTLAVLAGQCCTLGEQRQVALVEGHSARRAMGLQPLGGDQVAGGAADLLAGREQAAPGLVFFGQLAQPVGHVDPRFAEGLGAGSIRCLRGFLQGGAHGFDLADAGAHLDGEVHREVPDIVGGEVAEHGVQRCLAGSAKGCCFRVCRERTGGPSIRKLVCIHPTIRSGEHSQG